MSKRLIMKEKKSKYLQKSAIQFKKHRLKAAENVDFDKIGVGRNNPRKYKIVKKKLNSIGNC